MPHVRIVTGAHPARQTPLPFAPQPACEPAHIWIEWWPGRPVLSPVARGTWTVQATTEGHGYSALALSLSTYARARKVAEVHAHKRGYEACDVCLTWHAPIECFACGRSGAGIPSLLERECSTCGGVLCAECCTAPVEVQP